jgi:uncharacterized membrane protein
MDLIKWALFAAMGATVVALVIGLVSFFKAGPQARATSNKMMQLRILFQALALGLLAALMATR